MDAEPPVSRSLRKAALTVALVILGVSATVWVALRLRNLIFMVSIALFVSVALEPAVQYLSGRGWKRRSATGFVFLVVTVVSVGFVASLVPLFVNQASELAGSLPEYVVSLQDFLATQDIIDIELIDQGVSDEFEDLGSLLARYGSSVAGGIFTVSNTVFSGLFQLVTITLFAYYMVVEGPTMRRTVLSVLPPKRQRELLRMWDIAVAKTGGYIYSRLLLSVVAAAFTAVVLTVLDLPYVVALGLWVGVISQFVPVVGTYIAAVLPVLVALFDTPIKALWVLVALVAYQQIENFWVAPKITAKAMAIHPAISIGSVIAGASLLGGIGAVLALPVAATIQAFISTVLERHEVIESESLYDRAPTARGRQRRREATETVGSSEAETPSH
ncbi:MAG: AI-2E family transporter [Acidimicrobiia bacterium]|nr:AI-2E family transporter [Acidimicrobiia bacterium]MDH4308228.1 AI-2E family transporter [Acidimicrobiia bacterium]